MSDRVIIECTGSLPAMNVANANTITAHFVKHGVVECNHKIHVATGIELSHSLLDYHLKMFKQNYSHVKDWRR